MLRERIITIDLDEGNYRILRYKQYDNNQILKIIIQENKEEVDLAFYTARLFFKLPSGSILEKDTTIKNNKIVVSIDSGILSENGRVIADLTLSSSEQLVTAFTMYLDVEETIDRNEAVQSKPEWDLITNSLNNLDTKVDKVEGKSLIANSEIERLANVDNYDDTELRNLIDTKSDTTHNHDTQYASKSNEHIHDNKNALDKVTDLKVSEWDDKSDFSGSYEDLTDKPEIPIPDVNKAYVDEQLSNKSDINHTHTELHTHNNKDVLDTITQEKINEWNSQSDFSGDYNDLINKPTIPTLDGYATENYVKNAIADAQLNGGGGGTGSVDLSGYATKDELNAKANVSDIPTKTSQLTNDSKFLTSVPSEYITESELNAKGYLTQHQDISGKVDKVNGKSLISNSEIERLANMEDNANNYVHPSTHKASMIVEDNTHRFITDLERNNWNNKVESSQLHEHSNKDVLDGITSDKVANWDKAEENIQSDWNITDTTSDAYIKNKPSIPSRVSELTNDNLYATETYVQNKIAEAQLSNGDVDLSGYATKDDLNTKVDKVNGKGLSTNDYTTAEKNKLANLSAVATSGNYNDLSNRPTIPTIPTNIGAFTNDVGYLTTIPSEYVTDTELTEKDYATKNYVTETVNNASTSGGYTHPQTHPASMITGLSTVATSGSYNDLSNKPTIPSNTSQLTNDSNFVDESYVANAINNAQLGGSGGSNIDFNIYQTKTDNTLTTTNKTIVGAINEINSELIVAEDYSNDNIIIDGGGSSGGDSSLSSRVSNLETTKADKTEIPTKVSDLTNDRNFATVSYVTSAISGISGGSGGSSTSSIMVSVKDYGAVGDGSTDDTEAIRNAISFMNETYSSNENYLNDVRPKGCLVVPQGMYVITGHLEITGNYDFEMIGAFVYRGATNSTMMKIGIDDVNICANKYTLNATSEVPNVIGFELCNMLSCFITTRKLSGFQEAMRCVGKQQLGWCGNYSTLGIFRDNVIDIRLTLETEGWPNANTFVGGFFYKNRGATYEQICVLIDTLDDSENIDSNEFMFCCFEEGKPNMIPIVIKKGNYNRFLNIRYEQCSDTCSAHVYTAHNIIDISRGLWNCSGKVIGRNGEIGHCQPLSSMIEIFNSGNLSECVQVSNNRIYSKYLTFADRNNQGQYSCISTTGTFTLNGDNGITLPANSSGMLVSRLKVNEDRVFNVVTNKIGGSNFAIRCYDASGNPLALTNEAINDEVVGTESAQSTWCFNRYVKTGSNLEYMTNEHLPYYGTGAYVTPYTSIEGCYFEVHPNVAYVEVYVYESWTGENCTITNLKITSDNGTAQVVDLASDRNEYMQIGNTVYRTSNSNGTLNLTVV